MKQPALVLTGLLWCGVLVAGFAQRPVTDAFDRAAALTDTIHVVGPKRGAHWIVKLNPLSLIDFESTYRVDVERMLGERSSVQAGVGYGTAYTSLLNRTNASDRETWRAQVEWRLYANRQREPNRWHPVRTVTQKPLGLYYGLEVFYKQVNAHFNGTLGRGCDDGTCQFFQDYTARAVRYVMGSHVKFGYQSSIWLSPVNNRLLIDYYVGVGLRWRWFREFDVPDFEDARPFTNPATDRTSVFGLQQGRFPSLAFGIQIGYAF